ncbi:MAG: hypothetical protein J5493_00310 [Lachnospiraceae bacterium]|nr:hypothetical protein [Lachnospiraceae bacterium]
MMTGGGGTAPAAPAAPAPQNNTAQIENYIKMAKSAADATNNKEAENYANRVLELDPDNAEAWLIKGKAAGWQSSLANIRLGESVECWKKAYANADDENKEEYKVLIQSEFVSIAKALIMKRGELFTDNPTKDNGSSMIGTITQIITWNIDFFGDARFFLYDTDTFFHFIGERLNMTAVGGSNTADKNFGNDRSHRTKYAWERFMDQYDACMTLLELAIGYVNTEAMVDRIVSNYKVLQQAVIDSCSYTYSNGGYVKDYSLTNESKNVRKNRINSVENKGRERKQKFREDKTKKRDAYWAEHKEEKEKLDAEMTELQGKKADLTAKIKAGEEEKESLPSALKSKEIKDATNRLKVQMDNLGLFKGKEKKALQEQIAAKEKELEPIEASLQEERKAVDMKLAPAKEELATVEKRIGEIQAEFEKDR